MKSLRRSECAVLPLVLKGEWYDMIERGEKKEEYRDITEYWLKRVERWMRRPCWVVELRRGYARNAARMAFAAHLRPWRREPEHPEWGEPETRHYVIALDERVELVEGEEQ